jgi:hypothetical protein
MLYNTADYDGAIQAAADASRDPQWKDTASLVMARAYLERFRQRADPADLVAGRDTLQSVRADALAPRERVDLLVGTGQSLFLANSYGAAADMFDEAMAQNFLLNTGERLMLLDWWANALDRAAQTRPLDRRAPIFDRLLTRMEDELRRDPANPIANYWLPAAARGVGNIDRAWDAAIAGWVRTTVLSSAPASVHADLDRLVVQVIVPERVRSRGAREPQDATKAMLEEWETIKQQWSGHAAAAPVGP